LIVYAREEEEIEELEVEKGAQEGEGGGGDDERKQKQRQRKKNTKKREYILNEGCQFFLKLSMTKKCPQKFLSIEGDLFHNFLSENIFSLRRRRRRRR